MFTAVTAVRKSRRENQKAPERAWSRAGLKVLRQSEEGKSLYLTAGGKMRDYGRQTAPIREVNRK